MAAKCDEGNGGEETAWWKGARAR
ncbi:hypothetical protein A2U01_0049470, partial [Trifolium medium]|nr:hypothetical protein [Trifolium medium]